MHNHPPLLEDKPTYDPLTVEKLQEVFEDFYTSKQVKSKREIKLVCFTEEGVRLFHEAVKAEAKRLGILQSKEENY